MVDDNQIHASVGNPGEAKQDNLINENGGGKAEPVEAEPAESIQSAETIESKEAPAEQAPQEMEMEAEPQESVQQAQDEVGAISEPAPSEAQPSEAPRRSINPLTAILNKCRQAIAQKKQKKLEKILQLAKQKQKITNDDVQKLILVSDKTATRYLDQLMKEGKLIRTGPEKHEFYKPV